MKLRKSLSEVGNMFFIHMLQTSLADSRSVLDIGCGASSPLRLVKGTFFSEGVDVYKPSLQKSKKEKIHNKYTCINLLNLDKQYKQKSFDAVIALDVIEHFAKKDAKKILKSMERIAKKKIVILTPNGYHLHMHCSWDEDNPFQQHKSGWFKEDFSKYGYHVYGLRGLKYLRDDDATIKMSPWIFWGCVAFISEFFLFFYPKLSFDLFAVKEVRND